MIVRDAAPQGVEVLLLQRNARSDFVAGAHVFPGGAVDAADAADAAAGRCVGRTDAECSAALGVEEGGLAFWVGALRECFEEAGLLLARHPGDEHLLSLLRPGVADRFAAHRAAVHAGRSFAEVLVEEDLVLDVGRLHYVSHWVTPEGASRRYDTRFFVAEAPPEQAPRHDAGETVATTWIGPALALDRHRAGALELVLPTVRNLEALCRFATVEELLASARAVEHVPTIRPRLVDDGTGIRILVPGDPGYGDPASAPS